MEGCTDGADQSGEVLADAAVAVGLSATPGRLHLVWALTQDEIDLSALAEQGGGPSLAPLPQARKPAPRDGTQHRDT